MTEANREDVLEMRDEDRLPWLEAVDDADDEKDFVSTSKLIGFAIAALLAIGVVIGGVTFLRSGQAPQGDGRVIAAAPGDYKVKPDTPGGMKVEGQGDTAFAASEGADPSGKIDANAAPEAPLPTTKAPTARPGFEASKLPAPVATAKVPEAGAPLKAPPLAAPIAPPAVKMPEGSIVQLGAYNSEAVANQSWTMLSKRFAYLADLQKTVTMAQVNGRTVYRLRAAAPGQAAAICSKLKVAGENCLIVN